MTFQAGDYVLLHGHVLQVVHVGLVFAVLDTGGAIPLEALARHQVAWVRPKGAGEWLRMS